MMTYRRTTGRMIRIYLRIQKKFSVFETFIFCDDAVRHVDRIFYYRWDEINLDQSSSREEQQ